MEPKLLAERLDVSESDVTDMEQRLSRNDLSLQAPAWSGDDGREVGDTLSGAGASAEQSVGDAELRRVFMERVREFAAVARAARSPDRGRPHPRGGAALARRSSARSSASRASGSASSRRASWRSCAST